MKYEITQRFQGFINDSDRSDKAFDLNEKVHKNNRQHASKDERQNLKVVVNLASKREKLVTKKIIPRVPAQKLIN